ncbi:hypothetical protein QYM36_015035 [Artemia franciscana]|nr:hypothetical protein QYM36_015035 [Artemia franciscana]
MRQTEERAISSEGHEKNSSSSTISVCIYTNKTSESSCIKLNNNEIHPTFILPKKFCKKEMSPLKVQIHSQNFTTSATLTDDMLEVALEVLNQLIVECASEKFDSNADKGVNENHSPLGSAQELTNEQNVQFALKKVDSGSDQSMKENGRRMLNRVETFIDSRIPQIERISESVYYTAVDAMVTSVGAIGFKNGLGNGAGPSSLLALAMKLANLRDKSGSKKTESDSTETNDCYSGEILPNSHVICTEDGELRCIDGWAGDHCNIPRCKRGCDPMHGYCTYPGECRCRTGYGGPFCNVCIPLLGCVHGSCSRGLDCNCKPGWTGRLCNIPMCSPGCPLDRGYCEKPGECRCRLGWTGQNCRQCQLMPGCKNGFCNKPLECICKKGWTGLLCQSSCSPTCHPENGYCEEPGECRCHVGWWGPDCNDCYPYPGCLHGYCTKPWECKCKPGWTGYLCDKRLISCSLHPDHCLNGGSCIESSSEISCKCPENTLGDRCEIRFAKNFTSINGSNSSLIPIRNTGTVEYSERNSISQAVTTTVSPDQVTDLNTGIRSKFPVDESVIVPNIEQESTTPAIEAFDLDKRLSSESTLEGFVTKTISSDDVALSIYKLVNRERPVNNAFHTIPDNEIPVEEKRA